MNKKNKILLTVVIGLVIAGIIAIGETIHYFREQEIKSVTESAVMQKSLANADAAMASFNKSHTDSNKILCAFLIREYYKDPKGMTLAGLSLPEILNSDRCENK